MHQASSPVLSYCLIWELYITAKCFFFPPHSVSLDLRTHCVGNLLQSIPQWYFMGGFPQMRVFFPPSNGKTELHRSGLSPDRQKNTNKINLRQLHLEPGWRCTMEQCLNRGEKAQQKRKRKKTEEINTGWPSLQSQLGVMGSHIALVR